MTNNYSDIHINRKFGYILAFGFAIVGFVIPALKKGQFHPVLIFLSLAFLIMGYFFPHKLNTLRVKWMILGEFLGKINTTIIFTLIYLMVFSTIHAIFSMLGRDRLMKKWKKYSTTFHRKENISDFSDPF